MRFFKTAFKRFTWIILGLPLFAIVAIVMASLGALIWVFDPTRDYYDIIEPADNSMDRLKHKWLK